MTDRELIVALFNAFGALSVRLLGESFVICVKDAEGNFQHIFPNDNLVTWVNGQGEVSLPPSDYPVFSEMHCPLHEGRCDMPKESEQVRLSMATPSD